ncbi:hypothetical protein [Candidatus Vidania fulgoroideorum]
MLKIILKKINNIKYDIICRNSNKFNSKNIYYLGFYNKKTKVIKININKYSEIIKKGGKTSKSLNKKIKDDIKKKQNR